jgi:NADPH:quinone reductase-like Zn-dependent oxidoreductase
MKALKVVAKGKAEVQEVDVPRLRDGYLLVKISHVGLNPTDWFVVSLLPSARRFT